VVRGSRVRILDGLTRLGWHGIPSKHGKATPVAAVEPNPNRDAIDPCPIGVSHDVDLLATCHLWDLRWTAEMRPDAEAPVCAEGIVPL
jgi:hypothetical protein